MLMPWAVQTRLTTSIARQAVSDSPATLSPDKPQRLGRTQNRPRDGAGPAEDLNRRRQGSSTTPTHGRTTPRRSRSLSGRSQRELAGPGRRGRLVAVPRHESHRDRAINANLTVLDLYPDGSVGVGTAPARRSIVPGRGAIRSVPYPGSAGVTPSTYQIRSLVGVALQAWTGVPHPAARRCWVVVRRLRGGGPPGQPSRRAEDRLGHQVGGRLGRAGQRRGQAEQVRDLVPQPAGSLLHPRRRRHLLRLRGPPHARVSARSAVSLRHCAGGLSSGGYQWAPTGPRPEGTGACRLRLDDAIHAVHESSSSSLNLVTPGTSTLISHQS